MYNSRSPERDYRLDEEVAKIENGGLFSKQRCQNLVKYFLNDVVKYLKCMMRIMMGN